MLQAKQQQKGGNDTCFGNVKKAQLSGKGGGLVLRKKEWQGRNDWGLKKTESLLGEVCLSSTQGREGLRTRLVDDVVTGHSPGSPAHR